MITEAVGSVGYSGRQNPLLSRCFKSYVKLISVSHRQLRGEVLDVGRSTDGANKLIFRLQILNCNLTYQQCRGVTRRIFLQVLSIQ